MKKWTFIICLIVCPLVSRGQNFVYPVPPDSIDGRQGRINYMAKHFWTKSTIADTTNFQGPKLLLDYLYLLKQADEQQKCIQSFVSLACRNEQSFGQILFWLDQILYESSSPHYDEDIYMRFMTEVVASEADSVMKLIPKERVKMMSQNQVGKPANDFSYVDKKGKLHSLYDIDASLLLLVFNNPDCSLCHRAEKKIEENTLLQNMLESGRLKVLAITPDADFKDWEKHRYPSSWLIGIDKESVIYSNRLYDIQRLPCMYLLDKDKKVLLKEADYNRLSAFLEEYSGTFSR